MYAYQRHERQNAFHWATLTWYFIDGAVVRVEGIFVDWRTKHGKWVWEKFKRWPKLGIVKNTGTEMGKDISFKTDYHYRLIPISSLRK